MYSADASQLSYWLLFLSAEIEPKLIDEEMLLS